jgi:uncharacterized protein
MKLQPDQFNAPFVSAYEAGWIAVNGERHHGPLVIHTESGCTPWAVSNFEELTAQSFAPFALLKPELIVFGSGERLRFPQPAWLAALTQARIGVESMDTAAACRTYNILASEGRRVIAALLPLA